MKELGIGLVGYGFIGKIHTLAYRVLNLYYDPMPVKIRLVGVCSGHRETAEKGVEQGGYLFATTDYHKLLEREDIHIIDCCTPNYLHKDILIDAMRTGKFVYCEKPLAMNVEEAKEIVKVAKETKIINQMAFQYRFVPAVMRAKQLIEEGFLGRVFHFRASYLHSGYTDPNRPITWRLDKEKGGGGALYDLGSHIIDLIHYLLGEYEDIHGFKETFIKERPLLENPREKREVKVDDYIILQVRMTNGALGTLEASRVATGTNDDLSFEIYGEKGSMRFHLMEPNWLYIYDATEPGEPIGGRRGFKAVECVNRYPAPSSLPGPKFSIGWERFHIASQFNFISCIVQDREASPSFEDGLYVQEVMERAYK
ncbi:MAG: Gfo/Idh/MocA family protein [bacterium]